ncbi:MAG: hypothetical protein Tsb0020_29350 [Haliangiales bacterium]
MTDLNPLDPARDLPSPLAPTDRRWQRQGLARYLDRDLDWQEPARFHFAVDEHARALILQQPSAASDAECRALAALYDRYIHRAHNQRGSYAHQPVLWHSALWPAATDDERQLLTAVKSRISATLADYYQLDLVYTLTTLLRMCPGDDHIEHADNADYVCPRHGDHAWDAGDCRAGRWQPLAGSWWRDVSALLYLNDGFAGGQVVFPQYQRQIAPRAGLLLAFPSNRRFLHAVTPVVSGTRYALALWLTRDRERAEQYR